jgi:hypothetical protein
MSLTSVLSALTAPSWLERPQELLTHRGSLVLSRNESRLLLDAAKEAIDTGNVQVAQNNLYAGLLLDEARFLAELQKLGILRVSRFSYASELLASVVSALLTPGLGLSIAVLDYLQSFSNLYEVARRVRQEYEQLRDWLTQEKEVGIKSALAWLDCTFLKAAVGFHETSTRHVPSRHPYFFSVEHLAEGFSSLLALYGNEIGELTHNPAINERGLLDGFYLGALISAAHVSAFREWEFQIDRQGYRLVATGTPGEYRLTHPSPEFHRSVQLGFIQVFQQRVIKTFDWLEDEGKSFHDYAPKLMKEMEEAGLIRLLEQPTARYRFDFPEEILQLTASVGELFLEERLALLGASRDLLTSPQEILDFKIQEGLTFRDLFQVARLIQFIRSIAAAKLIPEMEARPGLVFQSIVPAFERDTLVELLSRCVPRPTAEMAITMWTTDVKGHVDIQYQPFVPAGSAVILPANVFSHGNVYRNPLQVMRRRLYEDGQNDPLGPLLEKKFREKGHQARTGFNYDQGEIDLLVLIDGILFALECKNSLVPTGPHELMTSLDYVHTAVGQLNRFNKRLADDQFRTWLAKQTGWNIEKNTRLVTGIVLSNRMFMGLRVQGHPVRGAYELEHFIDEGTISMGEESHRFWLGNSFTGDDLRRFLEDDITYQPQWSCLRNFEERYQFDGCTVLVERLYLDMLALADHFGFAKARVGLNEQQASFEKAVKEFSLIKLYQERFHSDGGSHEN